MKGNSEAGVTLIEATVVIMVVAILAAAAAPSASRTLDRARQARAVSDGEAIKTGIINYRANVFQGFTEDGTTSGDQVEMLVSDGDIPLASSILDDNGALTGALLRWDDPVGDLDDTNNDVDGTITVDFLERHLVTNNILGVASYGLTGGNAWRGAYMNAPIDPDPWGNRYMVNTKFLDAPSTTSNDTIVLSVGPDEAIDTLFERNGQFPGGDDIIVTILRDRNSSVP